MRRCRAASAAPARVQLLSAKIAVLDAEGEELDDDWALWDGLVGNLNDEDDVWSDHQTHYNEADRSTVQQPVRGP